MTELVRPRLPAAIVDGRIVAIGRRLEPARVPAIAEALVDAGIGAFEITLDGDAALHVITDLTRRFPPDRLVVGAGTILERGAAEAVVDAGAAFLVSPHTDPDLVAWAAERGLPFLPGAMTPTEILAGWRAGAAAVKVFPASAVGPSFVRELRGPLREVPLLPTGGITLETAAAFLTAGAVAVGIGSWLTAAGDAAVVAERAAALVAAVRDAPGLARPA